MAQPCVGMALVVTRHRIARQLVYIGGQPAVQVIDIDPPLLPGEVEIDVTVGPEDLALEDLLSRCCGGGVSERAAAGPSSPEK